MEIESGVKSGDKRPVEEEEEGEGGGCVTKKVKREGLVTDMRKVAEMVLVLAAMGKMRGGRVPSEAEKEIMSTARTKLAEVCQCFAPKDVFPRDVFGGIIEDLGLNKVKEQRLGFRPPKISIAEKLMFSKRKVCYQVDFLFSFELECFFVRFFYLSLFFFFIKVVSYTVMSFCEGCSMCLLVLAF